MSEGQAKLRIVGSERSRSSPFSYACASCGKCCRDKLIHVGPYEIARLAKSLDISTTELIERHTTDAGSVLATREDGTCVFLEGTGCRVHADRPLVCRLYPLGRVVHSSGGETFVEVQPHPESEGVYGENGTVADFIAAQGALPYIDAASRYYRLLARMVSLLSQQPDAPPTLDEALSGVDEPVSADRSMDVDACVADYCHRHSRPVPEDLDAKVALHLDALAEWLDEIERES